MNLWERSAILAYVVAFVGVALVDHLWAGVGRQIGEISLAFFPAEAGPAPGATAEMVRASKDFDATVREGRLFIGVEAAAIFLFVTLAFLLRPNDWGEGFYAYIVLVTLVMTVGREVLGLAPAFTAPFGGQVIAAWILVMLFARAWNRFLRRR
jgi:hypothetical protein